MKSFKDKLSGEAIKYSSDKCPAFISNIDQREAVRDFVYEACLHSAQWAVDEVLRILRSDEAIKVAVQDATSQEPFIRPACDWADWLSNHFGPAEIKEDGGGDE